MQQTQEQDPRGGAGSFVNVEPGAEFGLTRADEPGSQEPEEKTLAQLQAEYDAAMAASHEVGRQRDHEVYDDALMDAQNSDINLYGEKGGTSPKKRNLAHHFAEQAVADYRRRIDEIVEANKPPVYEGEVLGPLPHVHEAPPYNLTTNAAIPSAPERTIDPPRIPTPLKPGEIVTPDRARAALHEMEIVDPESVVSGEPLQAVFGDLDEVLSPLITEIVNHSPSKLNSLVNGYAAEWGDEKTAFLLTVSYGGRKPRGPKWLQKLITDRRAKTTLPQTVHLGFVRQDKDSTTEDSGEITMRFSNPTRKKNPHLGSLRVYYASEDPRERAENGRNPTRRGGGVLLKGDELYGGDGEQSQYQLAALGLRDLAEIVLARDEAIRATAGGELL